MIPAVTLRLAAALLAAASPLAAQTMRTYSAHRPLGSAAVPLRVTLDFGAGRLAVQAGDSTELYRTLMRYDAERFTPVQRYDSRTGLLRIGLETVGHSGLRVTSRDHLGQAARFSFAPTVPLYLDANLGASDAALDLARLQLRGITVSSGATMGTIDVSAPTTGDCERAVFRIGAGELRVRHFANAGCASITLDGGAGRLVMGMDGTWRRDTHLVVSLAMGTLTLQLPRDIGLRIRATDAFLARVAADGLVDRNGGRESVGFDQARHHLTVDLTANVADITVERRDP